MPISPYLGSVNSGEFSPRMEARVDFERYPNAAKLCRNLVLFPQGGATRRPGTRFVAEVKDSAAETILIPFEFSEDDSYIIEAGSAYFRFFRRQGRIVVEGTDAAITNGAFAANITGWTDQSTGTAAIAHDATAGGRMQLTGASGSIAWAEQAVAIDPDNIAKVHVLRFMVAGVGGGTVGLQIGSASTGDDILPELQLGAGCHSIEFTPGATGFYVQFRNQNTPVRNMFVDDVSFVAGAAMELASPYATADLETLQYFQAADVVYLLHPSHPPLRLERRGHRSWSIVEATYDDGPYLEINGNRDLTKDQLVRNALFDNGINGFTDNSTGDGFVAYNEAGKFAELDPGSSGGSGNAVMRTSVTVVSGKKHVIHVLTLAAGPVTVSFGTSAGGTQYSTTAQQPGWTSYELTTSATTLHIQFSYGAHDKGRAGVGGCLVYSEDARLLEASGTAGTVTLDALGFAPFSAADVGRLVRLEWPGQEPGYGVISGYTSASQVSLLVLRALASTAPTESWRFGAWGGDQGYPATMAFFDGRAVLARSRGKPNTLWFSQSGDLQNMRPDSFVNGATTVEDDDAISATLQSTKINPVFWLSGLRQLMVGTAGGQWVVKSSQAVITPSDISAKQHAAVPCANMRNIEINQTILFADRARREVHDLGFSLEQDSFIATDLTILADHMFRSRNEQMVYQRNPYSIVWCRRADGRLAAVSYNKGHQVLGWSQAVIGGRFGNGDAVIASAAAIPGAHDSGQVYPSDERNELWLLVKRTIDGQTKRYIEFMEYFFDGPLREDYDGEIAWQNAMREAQVDAFYVDCGLTYDGPATTTISGLDHLEGETVKVLADGKKVPDKVVTDGSISFNDAATKVHVGLGFTHKYEGLKITPPTTAGSSVGKVKIISGVGIVVLDCDEFKITTVDYDEDGRRMHDLDTIKIAREFQDPDDATPLFTGELHKATEGSFARDSRIYIEGDSPLPFTLLGLAPIMEVREQA